MAIDKEVGIATTQKHKRNVESIHPLPINFELDLVHHISSQNN